ncbi:MAG TPA: alpha/beta hydrolase [Acidothermaceae bacterium]|jgi:pimeloyl-ACP methyl ester carboxylesterase|nr:alpha/beta hydrolase [Acidothermaceae bacterium]
MDAASWSGRMLETSRGQIFVRQPLDAGAGRAEINVDTARAPMLFVHGLGGESLDWVDIAVQVSDLVECYALDLPGFANSPPPTDSDLSLDGLARAVAEVARSIGKPVHLVANSLGGTVAVRVAAEHPELVASLTLVAPALPDLHPRLGSVQLLIGLLPLLGPVIVRTIIKADPEWMARRVYALCYGDPKAVTPERHARELATLRRRASLPYSPRVYRDALRATVGSYVDRGPRRPWLQAATVDVPTLVFFGGRDKLVSDRVAARANRTFRDIEVLRLPGAGHLAHFEDPAAVVAAMRAFLSGLRPPHRAWGMSGRRATVDQVGPGNVTEPLISPR